MSYELNQAKSAYADLKNVIEDLQKALTSSKLSADKKSKLKPIISCYELAERNLLEGAVKLATSWVDAGNMQLLEAI